ncbi:MAG: hypothetical protein WDM91_22595 [Rhizomicrobium sp.]
MRSRLAQQKFQLAQFVAAAAKGREIVALDENADTAEIRTQPLQFLDRGRTVEQAQTGKARKVERHPELLSLYLEPFGIARRSGPKSQAPPAEPIRRTS